MSSIDVPLTKGGFGSTARKDTWWVEPLLVFLGFSTFIVYSTWAAMQGNNYEFGPYLSPFYSPLLMTTKPGWWPAFMPFSAAMLILWAPGGFRFTCYYYRGAYYKAFWADPPSCAVGEPRKSYWGERRFPLIIQNVHRYFLYLALIFIVILAIDAYRALWFPVVGLDQLVPGQTPPTGKAFGMGLGTIIMIINPILLGSYTLGCHSLRHLVGGRKDAMASSPVQKAAYDCVSCLNRRHMLYAWLSLFWVGFTDVYVRLCAMHIISDPRLF